MLANRAALRALPLIAKIGPNGAKSKFDQSITTMVFGVFRATAIVQAGSKYPDQAKKLKNLAVVAAFFARSSAANRAAAGAEVARAAGAAAACFSTPKITSSAAAAASAAHHAARALVAAEVGSANSASFIWGPVSSDAQFLNQYADQDLAAVALARCPLWLDGRPKWVESHWTNLKRALPEDQKWEVWLSWYENVLSGSDVGQEYDFVYADVALEKFDEGVVPTNSFLSDRVSSIVSNTKLWDFFVSYANEDENAAREVVEVIESAGYTVVAQYKNFKPGAIFVREMERGLAESGRFIAVQSQKYKNSDHCQAEWAAAYNSDPGGKA